MRPRAVLPRVVSASARRTSSLIASCAAAALRAATASPGRGRDQLPISESGNLAPTSVLRPHVPLRGLDHSRKTWTVVRLVDVENVIGSLSVGVEIERRRETPACGGQKESMVPQVIVPVADRDVEGYSPE